MGGKKGLWLIAIVTFVTGAMLTFPARVAYNWFAPDSIRLSGVDGSVWSGKATEGSASGVYFSNLTWSFRPLALVTGKLAFDTEVTSLAGRISTGVAAGLGDTLTFTDLSGNLSLASINPALQSRGIDGILSLRLQSLVLKNGLPVEVAGTIDLTNLVARAFGPGAIGNFTAVVSTDDSGVVAMVEDTGASIDLTGTINLHQDRSYLFSGLISDNSETPPAITQQLRFLGTPDANGRRPFRFEGAL